MTVCRCKSSMFIHSRRMKHIFIRQRATNLETSGHRLFRQDVNNLPSPNPGYKMSGRLGAIAAHYPLHKHSHVLSAPQKCTSSTQRYCLPCLQVSLCLALWGKVVTKASHTIENANLYVSYNSPRIRASWLTRFSYPEM